MLRQAGGLTPELVRRGRSRTSLYHGRRQSKIRLCNCVHVFTANARSKWIYRNLYVNGHRPRSVQYIGVTGRLLFLFQCCLPSGRTEDITLVQLFKKSNWRPKTLWKNCQILEDSHTIFILPHYLMRGAHMVNCFRCNKADNTFYLNDAADFDWFLRAGNWIDHNIINLTILSAAVSL